MPAHAYLCTSCGHVMGYRLGHCTSCRSKNLQYYDSHDSKQLEDHRYKIMGHTNKKPVKEGQTSMVVAMIATMIAVSGYFVLEFVKNHEKVAVKPSGPPVSVAARAGSGPK